MNKYASDHPKIFSFDLFVWDSPMAVQSLILNTYSHTPARAWSVKD